MKLKQEKLWFFSSLSPGPEQNLQDSPHQMTRRLEDNQNNGMTSVVMWGHTSFTKKLEPGVFIPFFLTGLPVCWGGGHEESVQGDGGGGHRWK